MKKYILTLFILLFSLSIYAQCVPDQQFTSPGIYPDQATNLPAANVGQPYSAIITALTPLDTVVDISGLLLNVTIANIDLTSITGLPNNLLMIVNLQIALFQEEHIHVQKFLRLLTQQSPILEFIL